MASCLMQLVVLVAAVAAAVTALPAWQDQEVERLLAKLYATLDQPSYDRYDETGHRLRNLDSLGGGNLVRDTRSGSDPPTHVLFGNKRLIDSLSGVSFGTEKRNGLMPQFETRYIRRFASPFAGSHNFDEIDRSGFNSFAKRNFDEIDRSGFDSFAKRNFDEIDRSGFNSFAKKNFDEIDRSGFNSFAKKNFDEIDRSGFNSFAKKNFDEIDRTGGLGFAKRGRHHVA